MNRSTKISLLALAIGLSNTATAAATPAVQVASQTANAQGTVIIPSVTAAEAGFVVIHESKPAGKPVVPASVGHARVKAGEGTSCKRGSRAASEDAMDQVCRGNNPVRHDALIKTYCQLSSLNRNNHGPGRSETAVPDIDPTVARSAVWRGAATEPCSGHRRRLHLGNPLARLAEL